MEIALAIIILSVIIYYFYKHLKEKRLLKQDRFIRNFIFPVKINEMVLKTYPHLSDDDMKLVIYGLKEYFIVCNRANNKMVSMPSQVIDVAWHEFILFTKQYDSFCKKALGRFLHHNPAEAMNSPTDAQEGIKLAWKIACFREKINPKNPSKLPLIFAIDVKLNIPDGFKYELNCKNSDGNPNNTGTSSYCATHINCSSCGSGCGGGGCTASGCSGGGGCGGS